MIRDSLVKIVSGLVLAAGVSGDLNLDSGSSFGAEPRPGVKQEVEPPKPEYSPEAFVEFLGDRLRDKEEFLDVLEKNNDSALFLWGIYTEPESFFKGKGKKEFEKWDIRRLSKKQKKAYSDFPIKIDFEKDPSEYDAVDRGSSALLLYHKKFLPYLKLETKIKLPPGRCF